MQQSSLYPPRRTKHQKPNALISKEQDMRAATIIRPRSFVSDAESSHALALETSHLSRAVLDRVLVDNISVQIQSGEVLAVVGPSGAGKSSFLRLLNRLDEPTGGTVRLNGQDYRSLLPRELRRRVGMVMQAAHLFPGTVATNVAFGPAQHGETLSQEEVAALLERVGLAGYDARDVRNLSGGEAQRVSLAHTLGECS
jgi:putative ABC transport system ATP-binding protein